MKTIPLTRGEFAIVDDEDFESISRFRWACHVDPRSGNKIAQGWIGGKCVKMHRFLLDHDLEHTDHKDGNGLNNQRANLRPATRIQNGQNRKLQAHSAPYKGVHFFKALRKWQAYIRVNRKKIHLGYFASPDLAASAYDEAALKHFGSFARTNHQIGVL